jgi:hypothetical protein
MGVDVGISPGGSGWAGSGLEEPEVVVQPALLQKALVGALLAEHALVHHHDLVGIADGGQPVGHVNHRLTCRRVRQ